MNCEPERRTNLIDHLKFGLRVTLIGRRVTVSMVMFQNPVLGTLIFAGKRSKARHGSYAARHS